MSFEKKFAEVRPLQLKLLESLKYFDAFCRENGIEYYAYGGTALGAARHKGFIPWDDDVDVVMTQENYNKFIYLFQKQGDKDKFYLQIFSKCLKNSIFAKLRMNGTTLIEDAYSDWKIHQGIFIDIFTLQECPNSFFAKLWQFICGKYIVLQTYAPKKHRYRGIIIEVVLKLFNIMPRFFLSQFMHNQLMKYNGMNCKYYTKYTERGTFTSGCLKQSFFGKPKDMLFEDMCIMVPSKIEEFLDFTYGNWKQQPCLEEIKNSLHYSEYYTNKDYKNIMEINDLSDENKL